MMTEFVRAKDPETGHEVTVTRQFAEGYNFEILDKDAVDDNGRPLPSKPKVNLKPAGSGTAASTDETDPNDTEPTDTPAYSATTWQNGDESK